MKRETLQNVKVLPLVSGETVVDTLGFDSAVIGVTAAAATVTVTIEHGDTADGTFLPLDDTMLFGEETTVNKATGAVSAVVTATVGEVVNVCADLAGAKQFIKVTCNGANAIVLGDARYQPVELSGDEDGTINNPPD
jgi:hypothetical protein